MLYKLLRRIPGGMKLIRRLEPYRFIGERESELCGAFNWTTRELLAGFPIGETDTVVDVGCGEGYASRFASRCGAAVYAVDIDPNALAAVERHMQGQKPARSFRTVLSDANPLPLADGVATRVVAQEVLEHVDDPRQFLGELVRIGRPGTRYLLSVPDPASESLQKCLAPASYWCKPNHLRVFARAEFDRLVRDAGLEIEKRLSYSFFWAMWWLLFWSGDGNFEIGSPGTAVLTHWHKTWTALLETPNGPRIKQALDDLIPKSQVILARKAA
jgi:SAM-dependent methyltransferase